MTGIVTKNLFTLNELEQKNINLKKIITQLTSREISEVQTLKEALKITAHRLDQVIIERDDLQKNVIALKAQNFSRL